ncbi:MAG TPA: acyl-CoA thioesterase, partial [Bellilinea sp.]|nr:acyl-CoA thioesterase [Bellilinea sp.]
MDFYKLYLPIQIRYGDLDPQWHVNNARFITYMEHGRLAYLEKLGLFNGTDFLNFPLIVADVHVVFKAPIRHTEPLRLGIGVSKVGTKSLTFECTLDNPDTNEIKAQGTFIMVRFDYT